MVNIMETEYNNRLSSKLLIFEKNSKEWEWSDLIKWLSGLKQMIEKYEIPVPNDQIQVLSKRLGQCLYPSLPPGLHSKTLEIYSCLLSRSPIPHISLLSTGLFPHFLYCAPQNKLQFLDLISDNYITKFLEINFILQGLFVCLLTGANDSPDTFTKVSEILDLCALTNKAVTHRILWWFILKSHRYRLAGLMYMQKKIDKTICKRLSLNSLLESLADNSIIIRRNTLDLIRSHFPLGRKNKKTVIILMQAALRLLRTKDHTLLRRIWEWVFPDEFDDKQVKMVTDILQPAVREIFKNNFEDILQGKDPDEAKLLTIKIAETLSENEGIGELILSNIAIDIVRYTVRGELFVIKGKADQRIKIIFSEQKSRVFWNTYEKEMQSLLATDEKDALDILDFAIQNFEFSYDSFPSIFKQLFVKLPEIKNLTSALDILTLLLRNIDIDQIDVEETICIYMNLLEKRDIEKLSKLTRVFGMLMNKGFEVPEIVNILNAFMNQEFLTGVSLILDLRTEVSSQIIAKLWDRISTNSHKTACKLLTKACKISKDEWNSSTVSLILHSDISIQEKYMRKFISFWQYMETNHTSKLGRIVRFTKIVFIMVDQLGSENPISKHLAKEWLCCALPTISHILDPILKIMLHKGTVRELNSDGIYYYSRAFDYKRVEDSIVKIILILENGGKFVMGQLKSTEPSAYSLQKCFRHSLKEESYLSLLLKIMLLYLQTPVAFENIQSRAAEVLGLLVKDLPLDLVPSTLNSCAETMYKILHTNNKIEGYLLKVLESLLSTNKIVFAYRSKFADSLILGLRNQKRKLRMSWMKFINLTLPAILNSITVPDLTNYLNSLFFSYYDIIMHFNDFSLLSGLTLLVHYALDINNKKQTCLIHSEVKEMIKQQIDKVLNICVLFYENEQYESCFDLNSLIIPMASMFQYEFIEGLLELWKHSMLSKPRSYQLKTIIKMIPVFNISPETIIETLLSLTEKGLKDEIITASFIQNVLLILENFKIPLSMTHLWTRLVTLLKHYSTSPHKELQVFQVNMIFIISSKISIDKKVAKDLQEIVKNLFLNCAEALKWSGLASEVCYYSTEMHSETICKKLIKALIYRGNFVLDIVFGKEQEKKKNECIGNLLNSLIIDLPNHKTEGGLIGSLVENYLKNNSDKVAEAVKSSLLDFYKNNLFVILERHPESQKAWGNILTWISEKYYTQKSTLLSDLMYHFEPSFWYRSNTILSLLYQSVALMCFIIFSSPKKAYTSAITGVIQKVNEILNIEDIKIEHFQVFCLLLKILYLRMPRIQFAQVWEISKPCVHIMFLKWFKDEDLFGMFEVLKFLDFMLATGLDDLSMICFYLFDVPEIELVSRENMENFKPAVSVNFLSGYSAEPKREGRTDVYSNAQGKRKLLLSNKTIENSEDLDRYVKILIQFCTFYSSEIISTDWESVESGLEYDISKLKQ